jgi:hypothetical protein
MMKGISVPLPSKLAGYSMVDSKSPKKWYKVEPEKYHQQFAYENTYVYKNESAFRICYALFYYRKKMFVIVKEWSSFHRTFKANVLPVNTADNIRKIPSFLELNSCVLKPFMICNSKVLRWQLAPEDITNLINSFSYYLKIHPKWQSKRTERLSCRKIYENTSIPIY